MAESNDGIEIDCNPQYKDYPKEPCVYWYD